MRIKHYLLMFVFVLIMLGQLAPMTLMREDFHPWYIGYTTVWGMASYFVFSPALLGTVLLGKVIPFVQESLWVAHWVFNVIWLMVLCYLASRVRFNYDQRQST